MKVKEIIEKLQTLDPETEVVIPGDPICDFVPVTTIKNVMYSDLFKGWGFKSHSICIIDSYFSD